jgi:hypothetical protein
MVWHRQTRQAPYLAQKTSPPALKAPRVLLTPDLLPPALKAPRVLLMMAAWAP